MARLVAGVLIASKLASAYVQDAAGLVQVHADPQSPLQPLADMLIRAASPGKNVDLNRDTSSGIGGNLHIYFKRKDNNTKDRVLMTWNSDCVQGKDSDVKGRDPEKEKTCTLSRKQANTGVFALKYSSPLDDKSKMKLKFNMTAPVEIVTDAVCKMCGSPCMIDSPLPLEDPIPMPMPPCPLPEDELSFSMPVIDFHRSTPHKIRVEIDIDISRGDGSTVASTLFEASMG